MANIKTKDISKLELWTPKELRKLRMVVNNRIQTLEKTNKPKEYLENHPLFNKNISECSNLLKNVVKAEKNL